MSRILVALLAAAAAIAVVGGALRFLDDRAAPPIVISQPLDESVVVVAVEGAVVSPGVYELPADARYADAVAAAGGLTDEADLSGYNPARRVRDEERVVVPQRTASAAPASDDGVDSSSDPGGGEAPSAAGAGDAGAPAGSGSIDINTATVEELDVLPGIGPVLAERIVSEREARGPFTSVDDLAGVSGISRRMVDVLRPLVTVGP